MALEMTSQTSLFSAERRILLRQNAELLDVSRVFERNLVSKRNAPPPIQSARGVSSDLTTKPVYGFDLLLVNTDELFDIEEIKL